MAILEDFANSPLLQTPDLDGPPQPILERAFSSYKSLHTFNLSKDRAYQQQYGDMYFLRLTKIKPAVEKVAAEAWADTVVGGDRARKVARVLDVRQGELCWVAGTVYMDMPLKPDVMDDVSKDVRNTREISAWSGLHVGGALFANKEARGGSQHPFRLRSTMPTTKTHTPCWRTTLAVSASSAKGLRLCTW